MNIFDKERTPIYNGDEVMYRENKYEATILEDGISLSNLFEEKFIKANHNDILDDVEIFCDISELENMEVLEICSQMTK